jgi:hypothetical protein
MIPVVKQRRSLAERVRDALPQEYVVVSNPDHPLVLRPPDLLIGGNGRSVALFIPTSVERGNESKLKNRIILNRLALPAHTHFVLVLDSAAEWMRDDFGADFSQTIELEEAPTSMRRLVRSFPTDGREEKIQETQRVARLLYRHALELSEEMVLLWRGDRPAHHDNGHDEVVQALEKQEQNGSRRAKRAIDSDLAAGFAGVPFCAFTEGKIDSTALIGPMYEQVQRLYRLDSGVPYRVQDHLGVLMVRAFPTIKQDPEKLLRAAALAGWSAMRSDQSNQIPYLAKRLHDSRDKIT